MLQRVHRHRAFFPPQDCSPPRYKQGAGSCRWHVELRRQCAKPVQDARPGSRMAKIHQSGHTASCHSQLHSAQQKGTTPAWCNGLVAIGAAHGAPCSLALVARPVALSVVRFWRRLCLRPPRLRRLRDLSWPAWASVHTARVMSAAVGCEHASRPYVPRAARESVESVLQRDNRH